MPDAGVCLLLISNIWHLLLQWYADRLQQLAQDGFGLFAAAQTGREARVDDEAVGEHRQDEALDVVGHAVVAILCERERLRGAKECERAAWANAEVEHLGVAGGSNDAHQVVNERGV